MTILRNQVFAEPKGLPLHFDLFRPEGGPNLPLVVCIHGGGWISGEKEDMHDVAARLAQSGFAAACPEYRLAPLHPFPAAVEDIFAFITHARAESESLGIDRERVASLGNSAGGHLAAMAGLSKFGDSRVQAVVDICGISDLTNPHGQHFPVSLGFLEQFMGGAFEGNEELWRMASPLHGIEGTPPPFLLIHGDADDIVPVGQSVALADAIREAGGSADLHRLPGEGHAFSFEAWMNIERLFLDFLSQRLLYAHRS